MKRENEIEILKYEIKISVSLCLWLSWTELLLICLSLCSCSRLSSVYLPSACAFAHSTVHVPFYLFVCSSISLFINSFIRSFVRLCACLCVRSVCSPVPFSLSLSRPSVRWFFACASVRPPVCPSVYSSVCPLICSSVHHGSVRLAGGQDWRWIGVDVQVFLKLCVLLNALCSTAPRRKPGWRFTAGSTFDLVWEANIKIIWYLPTAIC